MAPIKPKRPRRTGGKVGRPPSEEGDTTLHIRMMSADRAEWEREADAAGLKVSTFVKMAVSRHLADEAARRGAIAGAAAASATAAKRLTGGK